MGAPCSAAGRRWGPSRPPPPRRRGRWRMRREWGASRRAHPRVPSLGRAGAARVRSSSPPSPPPSPPPRPRRRPQPLRGMWCGRTTRCPAWAPRWARPCSRPQAPWLAAWETRASSCKCPRHPSRYHPLRPGLSPKARACRAWRCGRWARGTGGGWMHARRTSGSSWPQCRWGSWFGTSRRGASMGRRTPRGCSGGCRSSSITWTPPCRVAGRLMNIYYRNN
mmetsp:Transcript_29077/g.92800  ORF Transcript_29077/g.92800 Transcript_29077/m.92800 type:complete len:222 (-) Transcript_29077:52-717(-)